MSYKQKPGSVLIYSQWAKIFTRMERTKSVWS